MVLLTDFFDTSHLSILTFLHILPFFFIFPHLFSSSMTFDPNTIQKPPPESISNLRFDSVAKLVHFVSLIPFLDDWQVRREVVDVMEVVEVVEVVEEVVKVVVEVEVTTAKTDNKMQHGFKKNGDGDDLQLLPWSFTVPQPLVRLLPVRLAMTSFFLTIQNRWRRLTNEQRNQNDREKERKKTMLEWRVEKIHATSVCL
jgi:hypothetical protein